MKVELIHHQQYRELKEKSFRKRKIIPDGNLVLLKGIKVTANGNCVSKHKLTIFLCYYLFNFEIYR